MPYLREVELFHLYGGPRSGPYVTTQEIRTSSVPHRRDPPSLARRRRQGTSTTCRSTTRRRSPGRTCPPPRAGPRPPPGTSTGSRRPGTSCTSTRAGTAVRAPATLRVRAGVRRARELERASPDPARWMAEGNRKGTRRPGRRASRLREHSPGA